MGDPQVVQNTVQIGEIGVYQLNPGIEACQSIAGVVDGILVLIDADEKTIRSNLGGDHAGMAAAAHGAVDDGLAGATVQIVGHLGRHTGRVVAGHGLQS